MQKTFIAILFSLFYIASYADQAAQDACIAQFDKECISKCQQTNTQNCTQKCQQDAVNQCREAGE